MSIKIEFDVIVKKIGANTDSGILNLPIVHVQCLGGRVLAYFLEDDICILRCIKCKSIIYFNSYEWLHFTKVAKYGGSVTLVYPYMVVDIRRESDFLNIKFNHKNLLEYKPNLENQEFTFDKSTGITSELKSELYNSWKKARSGIGV
jgi:hypothetical protein